MGRRDAHQLALPIAQIEPPERLLRKAYERSRLKQSFEDAMKLTHLRIALRCLAMAMENGKRRKHK